MHWQVPFPILVTGYTNTAVDNLAEGLQARGLKVLRYGAKVRIRQSLWDVTLDGHIDNHRNSRILQDTKKKLAFLPADSGKLVDWLQTSVVRGWLIYRYR